MRNPTFAINGLIASALESASFACFMLIQTEGMQWHVMWMLIIARAYYQSVPKRCIDMAAIGLPSNPVMARRATHLGQSGANF